LQFFEVFGCAVLEAFEFFGDTGLDVEFKGFGAGIVRLRCFRWQTYIESEQTSYLWTLLERIYKPL